MRKVIVSLVVVLVVGAGGYFGVDYWAQNAVAREVDAMLDGWRASVGSATRGRIELDLWARTVRITDVVVQPRSEPHPKITVGLVVASGFDLSGKPARIELIDVAMSDVRPGRPRTVVQQTAPSVTLTEFSARPVAPRKVVTALDGARLWLEQFRAITAARIEIPSLTVTMTADNVGRTSAPSFSQYTYANLVLREVGDGKVAEATTDGISLSGNVGPPFFVLKGEIGKSSVLDADVAPLLAFLDSSRSAKTEGYQRVYRQVSMGPYTLQMGVDPRTGMSMRVDGIVAQDVGLHPGKLSLDDLMFLSEITGSAGPPGTLPVQPGQLTMLVDKMAGLYEGVSLGRLQMQGLSVTGPRERVKLAALRIERMENGRLGELVFDGLDARPPVGDPVSFGRFAFKGLDLANLLRLLGTELTTPPGQSPSFDRIARMYTLLEGFEIKGIEVLDPSTRRKALIDASVTSGPSIAGLLPTNVRSAFKVSIPLSLSAPEPLNMLVAAGFNAVAAEADLGMRWDEAAQSLALEPASLEVAGIMAVSLKGSIGKVTRDLFSTDVMKAMEVAVATDIGPIELTLRDLGIVDILAAEVARSRGQGPEAGRSLLLENWTRNAERQTQLHPSARPFFDAVGRFLQGKGETLTVRLMPRGRVRVMALAEALRLTPDGALLAAFDIEASSAK
jgi:hypothetical protein